MFKQRQPKSNAVITALTVFSCFIFSSSLPAQEDFHTWEGQWAANGTYFKIAVTVKDNVLKVTPLESLGFEWTSKDAVIDGNIVEVEVDYITGGVSGVIRAELLDDSTGVLSVKTCTPEFMVSCALSKGRQAYFTKVAELQDAQL
ncbi:MAG: hypothetical protein ACJA2Q_001385 [Pseudohongiellaceae bacterium]|jgi:hypothetical protein